MDKVREAFEQYIRSKSGFTSDFQIGCNGQYKSDLMHFMFITWQEQQKRIDELQARVDAANKIAGDNLLYVSQNHRESFKPLLMTMQRSFNELKQALKGGEV